VARGTGSKPGAGRGLTGSTRASEIEDVELFGDVRVVADQLSRQGHLCGKLIAVSDHAEPLARFASDPRARIDELRKRVAELVDRRARGEEIPDEDADDQMGLPLFLPSL